MLLVSEQSCMAKFKKFIDRELSWLSFNHRVLQEAHDPKVPLIERLRFLGIFSNNLDEFFKVRVATIKRMIDYQDSTHNKEIENPKKVLGQIQKTVIQLQNKFENAYQRILAELESHQIYIINENQLNNAQAKFVRQYFDEHVLPVLTPIILSNVPEFPHLRDKSIYLATKLSGSTSGKQVDYALLEIPSALLPRFIQLPDNTNRKFIVLLDDIIRFCLHEVFRNFDYTNFEAWTIKITRDAELDLDNDVTQSLLEKISKGVSDRKKGQPVRFVFDNNIAKDLLDYLITKMQLDDDDNIIPGSRYHNFKDFMKFPDLGASELNYWRDAALIPSRLKKANCLLSSISEKDILLHVPYQNFTVFINLLREAAIDPDVRSISITLYRAAQNSKVINALINAAHNGKVVTVVVELQARFDEKANIFWSKKLEEAGVKVIFGVPGLKVHAKLVLITRKEQGKTRLYACVSTGNFHEGNAKVYTDLTLMTADSRISNEVAKVFDFFENNYKAYTYKHLLVAPLYMRRRFYILIDNEIRNAKAGKEAYIILKINNLVDKDIINKLYQASSAGVKVRAIVRGICCMKPGVPGLSDNIQAISVVDKYLEHSRLFVFCNGGKEQYYISSADWMPRNLDRRVEVACPIYDKELQTEIRETLEIQFADNVKARIINDQQDNQYRQDDAPATRSQADVYNYYKNSVELPTLVGV